MIDHNKHTDIELNGKWVLFIRDHPHPMLYGNFKKGVVYKVNVCQYSNEYINALGPDETVDGINVKWLINNNYCIYYKNSIEIKEEVDYYKWLASERI